MTAPAQEQTYINADWSNPVLRLLLAALTFVLAMHVCGTAFGFQQVDGSPRYLVADDSMITLRVANNFAHHHGLYFNPGERTAANTSLFWPILLSPVFRMDADAAHAVAALSVLSAICSALTIALVVFFAGSLRSAVSTGITLLLLPGLAAYGSSVWEHIPQALLVTMAFFVFLGRVPSVREAYRTEGCLILLALAFLLRPDTLPLIFAVIGGSLLWQLRWTRHTVASALGCLLCITGYFALHHHLYGSFVPNTFYLKVSFGLTAIKLGVRYLPTNLLQSGIPAYMLALIFIALWYRRSFFNARELTVILALLLQMAYIVLVGGDVFRNGRFFLLVGPISVALLWEKFWQTTSATETRNTRPMLALATAIVALISMASMTSMQIGSSLNVRTVFYNGFSTTAVQPYADQAILADYLRARIRPEDGQVGLFALGALSFYMPEYKVADFLGKADPVIAHEPVQWGPIGHNKWDFVHSLRDRNVSVIPFHQIDDATARSLVAQHADFAFPAAFQLDPYLRAHYTYRTSTQLNSPGTEGLYIRNDLLKRFPIASPTAQR